MPTVELSISELENLMQYKLPRGKNELNEIFAYVKGEVNYIDEERIDVEVKDSNHPDLWGVEGISRALKGYLGIEKGLKHYVIAKKSGVKIAVHKKLEKIRPFIACGVVEGTKLTDAAVKGLMHLQDKLDQTYGRSRRRTSIGLYNFDLIKPPISYTVSKPDESSFIPLDFDEELTLREILKKHPKGVEYRHIVENFKVWPILKDNEGKILSFPPIINSNDLGKISESTDNILIEVTGTIDETVSDALTIICTALADRGGKIETVEVNYNYIEKSIVETPSLITTNMEVTQDYIKENLGLELTLEQILMLLKKSRYNAEPKDEKLIVEIPCYRKDILHPIDIVEDIIIAYNLNKIQPRWPAFQTFGALTTRTKFIELLRELAIGYGLQEIISFSMSNKDDLFRKMNIPKSFTVEVENPKIPTYTCLRTWIIPSLLEFLQHNTHFEYPQKIFEIGDCAAISEDRQRILEQTKLGIAVAHKDACFTEAKSMLSSFIINLGMKVNIEDINHTSFIEGRVGKIFMDKMEIGILGEIHPLVLENWNLTVPVSILELNLTRIARNKI